MSCLPCFNKHDDDIHQPEPTKTETPPQANKASPPPDAAASSKAKAFTFRDLAMATRNFRQECLIGEGGFGRVFKGKLQASGQVVAVKQLDRNGMQGNKEFLDEVLTLSLYQHPNLVTLIGYCADGDQRLLVYEFMEMGSLENHLFGGDPEKKQMDWYTRMKIASGAAQGLEYMHDTVKPSMLYRDLKPSNILLDESYEPKLSDYGLTKLGEGGEGKMNPTSRVMGTYGYSAPEYSSSGELTLKSDIYSFGVVLLELITGRRAIDTNRPNDEQNLVTWAQPIFREPKRFIELADPRLNKEFPVTALNQVVGICAMCLQEESSVRPLVADVVAVLSFLSVPQPNAVLASSLPAPKETTPPPQQKMNYDKEVSHKRDDKDGSSEDDDDDDDGSSEESEEEGSDEESVSENPNDGNYQRSVSGSYNTAEGGNISGRESSHYSDRRSTDRDNSEEESEYSDSDDANESDNDDDSNHSKRKDVGNSKKHGARSGSSKRAMSSKKSSSKQSRRVVTFKEPGVSSKINDKSGDNIRQSSSSSSGRDSECDGEEDRAEVKIT